MAVPRGRCLAAVLLTIAAHPATAQRIHGFIHDSATADPVAGAVVTVTDSAGRFLSRTIADAKGHFEAPFVRGATQVSIIRIGFTPRQLRLRGDDSALVVFMRPIPVSLSTVSATGKRVCPGDKGESQALQLWEQARAGLLAGLVARETNAATLSLMSYIKTLDPVRKQLEDETWDSKTISADRPYVAARPAWAFAREGYVQEEYNGARVYLAPDESVLLDETFADTHCLHVVKGESDHLKEVGIGFDPARIEARDTLVDIKGVLWMNSATDRAAPSLRSLDFEYTGLEPAARGSGGRLEFQMMPTGAPAIVKWTIHSPMLATDAEQTPGGVARRLPPRHQRTNVRVLGYREAGGEVGRAEWRDGTVWSRGGFPRLLGEVRDTNAAPVRGALVWLVGDRKRDSVVTDAEGRFAFPFVPRDRYAVFAADSLFASIGVSRTAPWSMSLWTGDTNVLLMLRPRGEAITAICGKPLGPALGVIVGRVLASDGSPVGKTRVEGSWMSIDAPASGRSDTRKVDTGDDGRFIICGVPVRYPVRIRAAARGETADVSIESWPGDVVAVTLVLKP